VLLVAGLASFYWLAAGMHAREVNTVKARGDQSQNLGDAEAAYANRHAISPPILYGDRNRMPLYGAFLGLFYDPSLTDPQFFEVAKVWNIRLSLAVICVFALILFAALPPHPAANLTLVIAFGYVIFKAGYTQPEVLLYPLFFAAFVACFFLFSAQTWERTMLLAAAAGSFGALAQLTKASVLPFIAIAVVVYAASTRRVLAALLMAACFLAVMFPYISTSKRLFGHYFYNVNTTFYVWYNDWPEASVGTHIHGDAKGWPELPPDQIPSLGSYWRTHSFREMFDRELGGFQDLLDRSYRTFWYLKYVTLYLAFAVAVIAANREAFMRLVRAHLGLFVFLLLYGVSYLAAIAFYAPISGTGTTRFLLPHVAPFLFALSYFITRDAARNTQWTVAGVCVSPAHFHLLVSVMIGSDVLFFIWARLATTYGGF
jgi:hypothetical protein